MTLMLVLAALKKADEPLLGLYQPEILHQCDEMLLGHSHPLTRLWDQSIRRCRKNALPQLLCRLHSSKVC